MRGTNLFTVEEVSQALQQQTANLCGMQWKDPFVMYGVRYLDEDSIANYCSKYRTRISELD
jgi:glutathione-regulated potassium-efflux system ancillary protein KefG